MLLLPWYTSFTIIPVATQHRKQRIIREIFSFAEYLDILVEIPCFSRASLVMMCSPVVQSLAVSQVFCCVNMTSVQSIVAPDIIFRYYQVQ